MRSQLKLLLCALIYCVGLPLPVANGDAFCTMTLRYEHAINLILLLNSKLNHGDLLNNGIGVSYSTEQVVGRYPSRNWELKTREGLPAGLRCSFGEADDEKNISETYIAGNVTKNVARASCELNLVDYSPEALFKALRPLAGEKRSNESGRIVEPDTGTEWVYSHGLQCSRHGGQYSCRLSWMNNMDYISALETQSCISEFTGKSASFFGAGAGSFAWLPESSCTNKQPETPIQAVQNQMMTLVPYLIWQKGLVQKSELMPTVHSPRSKEEYCSLFEKNRSNFQNLLRFPDNRLAFGNPQGYLNTGLCWWHSMLQRNATYLSVFRPDLPKLNRELTKKLLKELIFPNPFLGFRVVEFPGYRNLNELSTDFMGDLNELLSNWQIMDGVVSFKFTDALRSPMLKPNEMKETLEDLYRRVNGKKEIVFTTFKVEGMDSHALLIYDVKKTYTGKKSSYNLTVVDSLGPTDTLRITVDQDSPNFSSFSMRGAPYIARQDQLEDLLSAGRRYCHDSK